MPIRRHVLGALACGALAPALPACSSSSGEQQAARALRRPAGVGLTDRDLRMRELVRCATLAPSSHNTQCWRFHLEKRSITIAPDLSRRCPVVDPDDHHVFVSLGCATENLVHAALAQGLRADARFDPSGAGAIAVSLDPTRASTTPLFDAIAERQCTRGDYDGKPLSSEELRLLEQAGTGRGVNVLMLTQRPELERVLDYVLAANTVQLNDRAFIAELKTWIRFDADEALRSADGLFTATTGNPALPRWLGGRLMDWAVTPSSENERCARQMRSSAGVAVFVSDVDDKAHWAEAGRCYERFALQATALGIRNAMLNQPAEVAAIRAQFAPAFGLGARRPDLVVRFGRGPARPWSMRRPVGDVLA